ncbi:MAG: hypothetical protein LLG40_13930 [Deltaproteobacteria bacterium]|nr:hypothetical protein [Deltaproteobacteria bacterium]
MLKQSDDKEIKNLNSNESFMKFIDNAVEGFNKNVQKLLKVEDVSAKTAGINIVYEALKKLVETDQKVNANNMMTGALGTLLTLALYDSPSFEEAVAILNHVMKERLFAKLQELKGTPIVSEMNKTKQ